MSKQQRRKGNAKTASSARAAELLDSSGQVVPFIGFDGCSTLPLSFSEKVADVSCNDILPEVRNAFKKLAKKDALTREKGLKEMAALLETLEMKQIERCFPLYASAFPKLALDGILVIRTACIRLLESFIKALRKSSERYVKTVLPYVIFAMHDGYSQVVQYANLLFTNCFNEENRRKAIAICLQVTCDIALQILERTHPLLSKGEGEETDNQRECRLSAQSLACLASLCERLDSAGERERIVKLIQNRHLYKQLISCSPQVMSGMFSLGSRLLILDWAEGVLQSGLPASALSNLDNPDRTVCRLAADYLVACAKGIHLFKLLNVNKAVIPKLVSIIRRKESHWMNLESKLMVIVKLTFDNVSSMDKEPFLGRVLDAFFDGMPADSSFSVSNWANALVELAEMAFSDLDSADENMKREDFVEHFFSKVFVAIELTMKREERGAMRAIAALPLCILRSETTVPQHMVEHFRHDLFMNLFNRLPASEPVVEQLFISPYCGTLLDLAVMILRSATSSAAIVAHIIESCDEAFLIQINRCTSLAEAVAAKVDWNANETRIIRALLRAVSVTQGSLSEFIKLDDEMCCARLVETVSSSGAWALLPRVLSSQIWQSVVEKAATFSIRSCEREKWRMVLECVVTLPNSTAVISSILENNELKNAELFIDLMIACAKNTVDEVCREKIATAALNCLFVSSAVCEELVRGTLEAVRSIGIADNYIAHFVNAKLDTNDFGQNGLDVALYLAYALPSSCINEFLLTAERLSTQLSYLREYDVEILERNAFLSASVELDLYSLCNSSYARRELPTKQMRRAIFLLSYIRNKGMFTDDSANTELVYALLFCVAVSCMVGFENAIERRSASAQMLALEEAVKETVMLNENGRRLLLRSGVQFALEHSISLTLLLALRQLGDGLDLSQIGNDLRSRIRDDGLRQRICCAASAVALKAVCDPIEWDVSCANDWVCRCELDSSLANSDSSTLLACFVCEGRSFFEGSLFIFQESEEGTDVNALNCALLRVLQRSCSSLDVMGSALRDFLLCALITALESCKIQSKHDHYAHFFLLFASLTIRLFIGCSRTAESTKEDPSFSEFRQEWNEFYRQAAEGIVVEWFLSLSERVAISHPALLRVLSSATHYCEESTFHDAKLPPRFDVELDCKNYPEWLQSIVIPLVPLFSHPLVDVQFAALRILRAVTVEMMLLENRSEEKEEEADESLALVEKKNLPVILTRILNSSPEAKADVPPVLLAWDAFVESLARFQLTDRVAYCNSMNVVLDDVMSKIFELLPQNPHACDVVLDYSLFRIERSHSGLPILSQYVFGLFYRTLTTLPALIRQWYTSLPRAAANLVDMYTTKHVAPLIWKKERDLISVQKMPRSLEVRVLGAVREIVAEYDLEDAKMTLLIELPADYPLSVPIIENENAIVNRDVKRKWLLQLTLFLAHQNGSVMDGILMWAKNIARHLEGAEDCTICMMTVHSKTLQLPRIRCKQCKNRFHADCLRKWFETSSQSTCPLCRSNFRTAQL